jgi:hypothetical protein
MSDLKSLDPLNEPIRTYGHKRQADNDVKDVIYPGPKEVTLWRKIKVTCDRLVQIDNAKTQVEKINEQFVTRPQENKTENAEEYMKQIVGRSFAGQT